MRVRLRGVVYSSSTLFHVVVVVPIVLFDTGRVDGRG